MPLSFYQELHESERILGRTHIFKVVNNTNIKNKTLLLALYTSFNPYPHILGCGPEQAVQG